MALERMRLILALLTIFLVRLANAQCTVLNPGEDLLLQNQQEIITTIHEFQENIHKETDEIDNTFEKLHQSVQELKDISTANSIERLIQSVDNISMKLEEMTRDNADMNSKLGEINSQIMEIQSSPVICNPGSAVNSNTCKPEGTCDRGWSKHGKNCYFYFENQLNRQGAYNFCKQIHARLVDFQDKDEMDAILQMFETKLYDNSYAWTCAVWHNGQYYWENCQNDTMMCQYESIADDLWRGEVPEGDSYNNLVSISEDGLTTTSNYELTFICKYTL